jgi:hypothetical protein
MEETISYFLKIFTMSFSSVAFGVFIFTIWIGFFWSVYKKFYGPFKLAELFFIGFYVENPFKYALIPGIVLGSCQGLLKALAINYLDVNSVLYGVMLSQIVTELLIFSSLK